MLIFPAIDLKQGRCVRLFQGKESAETVYSDDPVAMARAFATAGAPWLHVVDLDAAFSGRAANRHVIQTIVATVSIPVQVGGGIRSDTDVEALLGVGVERVVMGTAAVETPELIARSVRNYGPDRVAVAIDARRGRVSTRGWRETSSLAAVELARRMADLGVRWVVYTEISRDGTLRGPDLVAIQRFARKSGLRVIASGGVGRLEDLLALSRLQADGVAGAIIGMALYEDRFTLEDALKAVRQNEPTSC